MSSTASSSRRVRFFSGSLAIAIGLAALWPTSGDSATIVAIPPAGPTEAVALSVPPANAPPVVTTAEAQPPAADLTVLPVSTEPPPLLQAEDLMQMIRAATPARVTPPVARFAEDYRSLRRLAALIDLPRMPEGVSVVGVASTYNPYREGATEGGAETASGERYDVEGWTAAIQSGLRDQFGGVRFGRLYQPAFALVECGEKQVIVKVNDVGPLKRGRIIDLSERSMRYFDPFLIRGLLTDVRVTLLPGEDWTPGPVGSARVIRTAGNL